jgi:hypothetical protein
MYDDCILPARYVGKKNWITRVLYWWRQMLFHPCDSVRQPRHHRRIFGDCLLLLEHQNRVLGLCCGKTSAHVLCEVTQSKSWYFCLDIPIVLVTRGKREFLQCPGKLLPLISQKWRQVIQRLARPASATVSILRGPPQRIESFDARRKSKDIQTEENRIVH